MHHDHHLVTEEPHLDLRHGDEVRLLLLLNQMDLLCLDVLAALSLGIFN